MPMLLPAPSLTLSPASTTSANPNHRPFAGGLLSLQCSNTPLQRRTNITVGQDVQLRPKPFGGTLPHYEAAAGAAVERMMRVISLLGLPVPAHLEPDVNATQSVIDLPVAEILQHVVADPRREFVGPGALA